MTNTLIKGGFENAGEAVRKTVKEVGNEVASAAKGFEAQLLYGTTDWTDEDVNRERHNYKQRSAQDIGLIRRELAMHDPKAKSTNESPINTNAIRDAQAGKPIEPHVPNQPKFKSVQHREIFQEAQSWGTPNTNIETQREKQEEKIEAHEEAERDAINQQMMDRAPESQSKKSGGVKFKRHSNIRLGKPKATARLKSAETRSNRE